MHMELGCNQFTLKRQLKTHRSLKVEEGNEKRERCDDTSRVRMMQYERDSSLLALEMEARAMHECAQADI